MTTVQELLQKIEQQKSKVHSLTQKLRYESDILDQLLESYNIEISKTENNDEKSVEELSKEDLFDVLNEIIEDSSALETHGKNNICVTVKTPVSASLPAHDELSRMTIPELKNICREKALKGYSKLSKSNLIEFIINHK